MPTSFVELVVLIVFAEILQGRVGTQCPSKWALVLTVPRLSFDWMVGTLFNPLSPLQESSFGPHFIDAAQEALGALWDFNELLT